MSSPRAGRLRPDACRKTRSPHRITGCFTEKGNTHEQSQQEHEQIRLRLRSRSTPRVDPDGHWEQARRKRQSYRTDPIRLPEPHIRPAHAPVLRADRGARQGPLAGERMPPRPRRAELAGGGSSVGGRTLSGMTSRVRFDIATSPLVLVGSRPNEDSPGSRMQNTALVEFGGHL
jgi:hypothetical protein